MMNQAPNAAESYVPKSPLEKHCAFFDRNKDGLLTPWETWEGFRALGFGVLMSLIGCSIIHLFLSYPTLDTWVPDPFFTIHLKNIHRCKHGSDTEVYDERGGMRQDRADYLLTLYTRPSPSSTLNSAKDKPMSGMGLYDGIKMIYDNRNLWDWAGWFGAILEWTFLYALCAEQGVIPKEAIVGQYDGTLFYEIEAKRRAKRN